MDEQKMPGDRGQQDQGDMPMRQKRKDRRSDQQRPNQPSPSIPGRDRPGQPEEEHPY